MSCHSCHNDSSCTDITSSSCVSFQGDAVSELDICINDSLTYVMNIVLSKIKDLLEGKGILLGDLTIEDCEDLQDLLGTDEKNLLNVLKIYKEAICQLREDTNLNAQSITDFTNVAGYVLGCVAPADPCGTPLTFKTLIQSIITKVCALDTQLSGVAAGLLDVVEEAAGNFLIAGAVKSAGGNGITTSGSGATAKVILTALVPPNCPILYTGSISNFDSGGTGLPNTPYQGWYLCNGSNGTPLSTSLPQNVGNTLKYIIRFN